MLSNNTYTDEQLLSLLKRSDEDAFAEIYNRYWEKLLAIAFNHTHNTSDAKEIVQNLFVGLWNRRDTLDIHSLKGYLATAVKFAVFKEYYRKQKREGMTMPEALGERMKACGLEHSVRTKLVYCNDSNRRSEYSNVTFAFLDTRLCQGERRTKPGRRRSLTGCRR